MTATNQTGARFVERQRILRPTGILDVQLSSRGEGLSSSTISSGQNTVKHVHAASNRLRAFVSCRLLARFVPSRDRAADETAGADLSEPNHVDPDTVIEIFVLDQSSGPAARFAVACLGHRVLTAIHHKMRGRMVDSSVELLSCSRKSEHL